jgi:hypothetical protein
LERTFSTQSVHKPTSAALQPDRIEGAAPLRVFPDFRNWFNAVCAFTPLQFAG